MAMSQFLTLFCVLLLMCWLPAPTASSGPFDLPQILRRIDPEDPDARHDKRSLNGRPYGQMYLSTEKRTLEIMPIPEGQMHGDVRVSDLIRPEFGALIFTQSCSAVAASERRSERVRLFSAKKRAQRPNDIAIRGQKSDAYLCMNGSGIVYGSRECTVECIFRSERQEGFFRYYSKKYSGRPDDPKRRKKKWYLGMRRHAMVPGPLTRKGSKSVLMILKPASDELEHNSRFPTATLPTVMFGPTGQPDRSGGVSVVVTSPSSGRSAEEGRGKRCNQPDPLNVFRGRHGCSRGRPGKASNLQPGFRLNTQRNSHKKQRKSHKDNDRINLFVIRANRREHEDR